MERVEELKRLVSVYMDKLTTKSYPELKDVYTKIIEMSDIEDYKDIVRNVVFKYEDTHLDRNIVWHGASILMCPSIDKLEEFLTVQSKKNKENIW